MKKLFTMLVLIATAALLAACNLLSSDDKDDPVNSMIQTDRDSYVTSFKHAVVSPQETFRFEIRFDIIAEYQNRTGQTVYLTNCLKGNMPGFNFVRNMAIVSAEDGLGTDEAQILRFSGGPPNTPCLPDFDPIKVEPGEVRADTIRVTSDLFSSEGKTSRGETSLDLEGKYRIVYSGGTCLKEDPFVRVPEECMFTDISQVPVSNVFEVHVE